MEIQFICENVSLTQAKRITQMEEEIFQLFKHFGQTPIPISSIGTLYHTYYNRPLPFRYYGFSSVRQLTLHFIAYFTCIENGVTVQDELFTEP